MDNQVTGLTQKGARCKGTTAAKQSRQKNSLAPSGPVLPEDQNGTYNKERRHEEQ